MAQIKHFPHSLNARNDRKIKKGRLQLGIEFVGIYWMTLEVLAGEKDFKYPLDDIDILADDFGTSIQKVKLVIYEYDLFNIDPEGRFFSPAQIKALKPYLDKVEHYRLMGKKSGLARKKKMQEQILELEKFSQNDSSELGSNTGSTYAEQLTNTTNKLINKPNKHTHTIDQWLEEYCLGQSPAYKAHMMRQINEQDPIAIKTYNDWYQKQIEKDLKEEELGKIDAFDYNLLVGLSLGDKTIKQIVDAGSTIHLFFEDGTDDYSQSKKSLYDWYQLKQEATA